MSEFTVHRELSGVRFRTPENTPETTGADGKTYPARQRTEAERQELVARLRQRGLSLRRIAELLGVHHDTIREDLSGVGNPTPENQPVATGADGKTYPARQCTEAERQELVVKLRQRGLSLRRIAEPLGVTYETARQDLSGVKNLTIEHPPVVQRADGKTCPARQRTAPNARSW